MEDHLVLPFQIGGPLVEAEARFEPECAWRAPSLTEGKGELLPAEDGSVRWAVGMACPHAFAAWCVANGPGITPLRPETVVHAYRRGLESVVARHG